MVHQLRNKEEEEDKSNKDSGTDENLELYKICSATEDYLFFHFYPEEKNHTKEDDDGEADNSSKKNQNGESEESKSVNTLITFIDGNSGKEQNLMSLILRYAPFIFFIVLGFLCIFGWFFCCICCCCPCCCCNQTEKHQHCCRGVALVISLSMCFVIVALCSYGLTSIKKTASGINGIACSIEKFLDEIIEGQNSTLISRWKGIDGVVEILDETYFKISSTENVNLQGAIDKVNDSTGMTNILETSICSCCSSPPEYDTILEKTFQEYLTLTKEGLNLLKEAKEKQSSLLEKTQPISDFRDSISGLKDSFGKIEDKVVKYINDYVGIIVKYIKLAFTVLFAVIFGLACGVGLFELIFVICGLKLFKVFATFFWNIFALLMILNFLIGSIIGIIGLLAEDATGILRYVIGEENLKSDNPVLLSGGDIDKLTTCFYGDGKLSEQFPDLGLKDIENNLDEVNKFQERKTKIENDLEANGSESKVYNNFYEKQLVCQSEMKETKQEIDNEFEKTSETVKKSLDELVLFIEPIEEVFSNYFAEDKFWELTNCKFMGKNVEIVLKSLSEGLGKNFYQFGVIMDTISCAAIFLISCAIIVMNRFNKKFQDKEKPNNNQNPKEIKVEKNKKKKNQKKVNSSKKTSLEEEEEINPQTINVRRNSQRTNVTK